MAAEMGRSLKRLRQDDFGPPYFMAYRLIEQSRYDAAAANGSVTQEGDDDFRTLYVEARFGSRALDNTDLGFQGLSGRAGATPESLRQGLWSLTDSAYKSAVAGFLEKKARRATEFVPDLLDDFSVESPAEAAAPSPAKGPDRAQGRALVERLSAVFSAYPHVYESQASARLKWSRRYLLTSEGTRLATPEENVPSTLRLSAMTRAADGMRLDNFRSWVFRDFSDLPPETELAEAARGLARELAELARAPAQAPMAAPAILDPEFTGVLFHEALGHKLEGQRQRDPRQSQVFRDLVGKKIIPEFLSLIDDPTMAEREGVALHGHYAFDAEGVAARRVALVERGVLRNFLMSRWPVKGFERSNGHGRGDPGLRPTGRMANLIVEAHQAVPREELFTRLSSMARKAGKPYGFLLVGAFGGENPNVREAAQTLEVRPRLVYRVDARTGRRTLVRGVRLVGTPLVILNRIVAAGDDASLSNAFFCGAESGFVPVSQIAPSMLVSEVELQRLPEDRARPPILPSPLHDREN